MPPRTKKKSQRGSGISLSDVARFVKNNKLISKGLGMIPHPAGQAASYVAGLVGLGRKKRATRKKPSVIAIPRTRRTRKKTTSMVGRGIFSDLGGGIGSVAHGLFGAGKKRTAKKRTRSVIGI